MNEPITMGHDYGRALYYGLNALKIIIGGSNMFHTWRTRLYQFMQVLGMLTVTAIGVFGLILLAVAIA